MSRPTTSSSAASRACARTWPVHLDSLVEYWNCVIDGHLQQGIDVFELDDNGGVIDQTVWLRPWPAVTVLRDRAIAANLPFLPAGYWLLPAGPSHLP
jgi:hypothetical protein